MPALTADTLLDHFGRRSHLARQIIPALHAAASVPELWQPPPKLKCKRLAKPYAIADPQPALLYHLQLYYATVIKCLAAARFGAPDEFATVESGAFFRRQGVRNLVDDAHPAPRWSATNVDPSPILDTALEFSLPSDTLPPPDVLKTLYHDLFPRTVRHALGEYYTPDWLASLLLDRLDYQGERTLLDPACGSGTFLALALRRMPTPDLSCIAGIDVNPLACLAAKVNLLFSLDTIVDDITLPVYCADSIRHPPHMAHHAFDVIAGNPPWVNWETLSDDYRQQTQHLWHEYGLFPHEGMDAILGKGKKDLALLLTAASVQHYLRDGGVIGFILTEAVLKSGGAGDGFRRFKVGDTLLRPLHVDDMTRMRPFYRVHARTLLLTMRKGEPPQYPVPYVVWQRRADASPLKPADTRDQVNAKTRRAHFVAEPIDAPQSAWLSGKPAALDAVRKVTGASDYTAHAGVYTGGANAVYWLRVFDDADNDERNADADLLRVQNIIKGAKRKVPQVTTTIEGAFVFPFLQGRDVRRWNATPSAYILVVQDPQTRKGYAPDWLREHYPRTYAYLAQYETALRKRAAYRRYFSDSDPFYSMFDVGTYTFAPYKVVWQGMGTDRIEAAVIHDVDGKPIMSNQAMHPFIGVDDATEAHYMCALLNSAPFEYAVLSHTQPKGKSFAQPGILERVRLPHYTGSGVQRTLATLSREAHETPTMPPQDAIDRHAAAIWNLTPPEADEIRASLYELRESR